MSEILIAFPVLAAGFLLGLVFYGGLSMTTRRGLSSGNPVAWFLASWILRITIVLVGFHLVSGGIWQRLLICLAGIMLARTQVVRRHHPRVKARRVEMRGQQ
jgi:F1F0 ATPase subunit 2